MAFMDFNVARPDISVLNGDCWKAILDSLDTNDILNIRAVSNPWRDLVQTYLQGVYGYVMFMPGTTVEISDKKSRVLKVTSTRNLREMLQSSFGRENLTRITTNADNQWLAEMTGHCPNLRDITLYHTFWNIELFYFLRSCEMLERVTLRGAKWVDDEVTYNLNNIKHIEIDRSDRITGSFLANARRPLESLSLRECPMLQGYQLERNLETIRNLTRLELDECPLEVLTSVQSLILELTQLRELSLSYYSNARDYAEGLAKSISRLEELRTLKLRKNDAVSDRFLKTVAQGCRRLHTLDVSRCNGTGMFKGVTDAGVSVVAQNRGLVAIDVSSLSALTAAGIDALHSCAQLETIWAKNNDIDARTFYRCFRACTGLKLLDVRGCCSVSAKMVEEMRKITRTRSQSLTLLAEGTSIQHPDLVIRHPGLTVRHDSRLDEPWERHFNNPDPEFQTFENYVDMEQDYQF